VLTCGGRTSCCGGGWGRRALLTCNSRTDCCGCRTGCCSWYCGVLVACGGCFTGWLGGTLAGLLLCTDARCGGWVGRIVAVGGGGRGEDNRNGVGCGVGSVVGGSGVES